MYWAVETKTMTWKMLKPSAKLRETTELAKEEKISAALNSDI